MAEWSAFEEFVDMVVVFDAFFCGERADAVRGLTDARLEADRGVDVRLAGVLAGVSAVFFAEVLAGAFFAGAFLAVVFFAGAFLAVGFLAVVFLADLLAGCFADAFFAARFGAAALEAVAFFFAAMMLTHLLAQLNAGL